MDKPWLKFYDPFVEPDFKAPEILVTRLLEETAQRFPESLATFFFGGRLTYGMIQAQATQFAGALAKLGFRKGDRLGILLANMPQLIISYFGAMKAGGTAVLFDPLGENEDLKRQINDSGVETLVALDLLLPRVDPIFAQTRLKQFIIAGVKEFLPWPRDYLFYLAAKGRGLNVRVAKKPNIHLFKEFLLTGGQELPEPGTALDDEAVMLFTAGISGPAKGVLLTHRNVIANVFQAASWVGPWEKGKESYLSIIPFHQGYGMTLGMNLPILLAGMNILQPQFETLQVLKLIKKFHPVSFPATPKMIGHFSSYPGLEKFRVAELKTIWAMDKLEEDSMQNLERRLGRKLTEGYGLTEAAFLTHANPVQGTRKADSIGIPLPGTHAKIMDPADGGREMAVGEAGELVVQGPQVMKGYHGKPEETAKALRHGWLHTGDLARMDEEGFFYYLGRIAAKTE